MFEGFRQRTVSVNGIDIFCRTAGDGPALLMMHGHPQTHAMWHKVAPTLARHFTVVLPDLRGQGGSGKPGASERHEAYAKRTMALDMRLLMDEVAPGPFAVLAHDRGARVAHRLGMDHPDAVSRMVLLDIAPTLSMYRQTSETFARAYWHWFFLIQPSPLPESLIQADPEQYLRSVMAKRSAGMKPFTSEAFASYIANVSQPGVAQAICEDYRASAGIDLEHDQADLDAGRRLEMPLLALWGAQGTVGQCFDPLEEWSKVAADVQGRALPTGHYIAEEGPDILLEHCLPFLQGS
ncbi:alpha/beta fold hydrolase [Paracandidimonas soli]|uniref:Haloacetate dehalogenase n=1 Tax=Paracandidimonas soli TaxID=1917182 RepID=A0A4R3V4B7_9BURK|nr:alpha/beta hydrolase [Paracandidimonas soli]TCU98371.1 haloacetate dehalogenase [Paracandidimonas soli]